MKQVKIGRKWFDVPDEARWLAQDSSGAWYWYTPPHNTGMTWCSDYEWIVKTKPPKDWTQELYELVDKD